MPDLLPSLAPAAPAAGVLPVGGSLPAPRDGAAAASDAPGAAFVDTLQVALAQVAGGPALQVALAQVAGGTALSPGVPSSTAGASAVQPLLHPSDEAGDDVGPETVPAPDNDVDSLSDELPELLATLGLLLLPPALVPPIPVAQTVAASGGAEPAPHAITPDALQFALPAFAQSQSPIAPAEPRVDGAQSSSVGSERQSGFAVPAEAQLQPAQAVELPAATVPQPSAPVADRVNTLGQLRPERLPGPQARASERVGAAAEAADAIGAQSGPLPANPAHAAASDRDGSTQQRAASEHSDRDTVADLATAPGANGGAVSQAAANASTAATATGVGGAASAERRDVSPSHVVAQIAHQAELYRLPGNRGVRVQLHPEDLGGLQVTVRYGAAGGLELHVNAEHAETGALVQSGWTELRDALALQGIAPERLIMNVTGGGDSNAANFADRGPGSNLAGFGQSQSGQQRREQSPAQPSRGWLDSSDSSTRPVEDTRPVAGGNSRIDYRA